MGKFGLSGIISFAIIDKQTVVTQTRYYVNSTKPIQLEKIPLEIMQEILNQVMFGNIDIKQLPIDGIIGSL